MNSNNSGSGIKAVLLIFVILVVIAMFKSCTEPSASDQWYQEHKEAIDTYNENHMTGMGIKVLGEIHGLRIKNLNMMVMIQMNIDKSMGISTMRRSVVI